MQCRWDGDRWSSFRVAGTAISLEVVCLTLLCSHTFAVAEHEEFFEQSIRPILAGRCVSCHGTEEQSGGLRLDSREALLKGSNRGAVLDLDLPENSRLLKAIEGDGDLRMPPEDPLSPIQVDSLVRWIRMGAPWPSTQPTIHDARLSAAEDHWAFQPVLQPGLPGVADPVVVRTPIDAFVSSKLAENRLSFSSEADRRTLIRRLSYTLTGLPPTPEAVEQFVKDPNPEAYGQLVDRLLESEQYGEHWARHWLDVARYSDTKGYVYAREERFWVHAWAYRDWVVRALNEDMPYDRFLLLQIAADQVADRRLDDLAAMGFLTIGRRFLGVQRDIIDDRIDVVCRGTMGLTVGCARCHDHKYDPIPTEDYYSLYGVFDSCREEVVRISDGSPGEDYEAELAKRQKALEEARAAARSEWSGRVRSRVGDYLTAQTELHKYPPKGFDQVFGKDDILPAFVHRWTNYLRETKRTSDPVFVPWHLYAELSTEDFAQRANFVTEQLQNEPADINPLVKKKFESPPGSFMEVIERYAGLFAEIDAKWQAVVKSNDTIPTGLDNQAEEQLRQVLYGEGFPCVVPDESIVHIESQMDSGRCNELWKLQGEVDRWLIQSSVSIPFAITLNDRLQPSQPRVFRRGNPATPGDDVPRRFLALLSDPNRQPFQSGSGRRELADAIIGPTNPLTSRVIVNRVWAHHFGKGLVLTPSDFGTRAEMPSHPQLLDWLAWHFVENGWSLKELHRVILNSAAYRQRSFGSDGVPTRVLAQQLDPENRLLWRMNTRRLSFEQYRDSLLAVGQDLDLTLGGKPSDLFASPYPKRRTLYGLVDRQFFPNTLRAFDFANPDLHIPKRPETTVPQQALFYLNHPFILERVRRLAEAVSQEQTEAATVNALYRRILQRQPTEPQRAAAVEFLQAAEADTVEEERPTVGDWQYMYGEYDETARQVETVKPLPHFTGSAWQGGPNWPDSALGWVQLNATGGHPGNDRGHAAIRRWTAPHDMTVNVHATWNHDAAPGDGIRTFLVSSKNGLLDSSSIHQKTHEYSNGSLTVESGETLDFIVDIGTVLNSDQYTSEFTISRVAASQPPLTWNSRQDFTRNVTARLSPVEQLAQVLVCSNEFLFVD